MNIVRHRMSNKSAQMVNWTANPYCTHEGKVRLLFWSGLFCSLSSKEERQDNKVWQTHTPEGRCEAVDCLNLYNRLSQNSFSHSQRVLQARKALKSF